MSEPTFDVTGNSIDARPVDRLRMVVAHNYDGTGQAVFTIEQDGEVVTLVINGRDLTWSMNT